jgi:deoxyribonuclease (pyrimidine dimer)
MTRINANIPPAHLIDQHLFAEYREMVRVPNAVKKSYSKALAALAKAPTSYKLGSGHVVFHYNKLKYLHKRFNSIKDELNKRGIMNNMGDDMFNDLPEDLYNDADLTYANAIVMPRILERINGMKRVTYYGRKISTAEYIKICTQ